MRLNLALGFDPEQEAMSFAPNPKFKLYKQTFVC